MSSRIDAGAKVAKSGVRAVRQSVTQALGQSQSSIKDVMHASGWNPEELLDRIEKALIVAVDTIVRRSTQSRNVRPVKGPSRYAAEIRVAPGRPVLPIKTALAVVGAGVLLSLLLRTPNNRPG